MRLPVAPSPKTLPRPARLLNKVGALATRAGVRVSSFDEDSIRDAARRATGCSDFGSTEYEEPLRVLLDALQGEADLSPLGRFFARGMVQHALENRLRLQRDWNRFPQILDEHVARPLIIVGLPRTGTTILQHLLALDPAHRPLVGWEAAAPSPPPARATYATDPRIRRQERTTRLLDYLAPEARVMHPVSPRMPTECVTLFVNSFASLETATIHCVPSYLAWCRTADYAPHYAYYRRQLQTLQWRAPGERWLLKSPAHLFWLDRLVEIFPDACIVMTHRDPLRSVASFCSLSCVLCGIGSDRVDRQVIGELWSDAWADALGRAEAVRERYRHDPCGVHFVDVHHDDLVADPAATVEHIYERFDLAFDPALANRVRRYVHEHPPHGGGVHHYSAAEFGLDGAPASAPFDGYRRRLAAAARGGDGR
jgi:hypothetical protein